jgi:hypothetical protein
MIIDCDTCVMNRTSVCTDCIVTVLLAEGGAPLSLVDEEERAIANLADAGLVAPLRLVPRLEDDAGRPRRSTG